MRWRSPLFVLLAAQALPRPALAVDYDARAVGGYYSAKESLTTASAGATTNDATNYLGRLYFDAKTIGGGKQEFIFDFRDRYDSYGLIDKERLLLVESNDPQLRQLVYRNPYENGETYWSVGRFAIPDAGLASHDGAELGFPLTSAWRAAVFGGLYNGRDGSTKLDGLKLQTQSPEAGAYGVFETAGKMPGTRTSASAAVVAQILPDAPGVESTRTDAVTGGAGGAGGAGDNGPRSAAAYFHTNVLHQPDPSTRLTAYADLYALPAIFLRNAYLSGYRRFSPAFDARLSVLRLDLTEYRRQADVRETLAPSAYTLFKGDLSERFLRRAKAIFGASFGLRGADQKSRAEAYAGFVASPLLSERMEAKARFGFRKNFESRDTYLRFGGAFFTKRFDIDVDQEAGIEQRDDGQTLHPLTTTATIGTMVTKTVLLSFGGEYARDERVSIASALLTAGWHYGSRGPTPGRDGAPGLERAE